MTPTELVTSPELGKRFVGQLLSPMMLLDAIRGKDSPDDCLELRRPLLGAALYAIAKDGGSPTDLVELLLQGPAALVERALAGDSAVIDTAIEFQNHPRAVSACRAWATTLFYAMNNPYLMELAEARTAQGPLPTP